MADTEVPYDGLDQDGDGADLVDADGDGFASQLAAGPDCNDRDPRSHPGATDVWRDGVDVDCDGWDAPPAAATHPDNLLPALYLVAAGALCLRWALHAAAAIPLLVPMGRPSSRSGRGRRPALRAG